jgi:hypothetical protein
VIKNREIVLFALCAIMLFAMVAAVFAGKNSQTEIIISTLLQIFGTVVAKVNTETG